MDPACWSWPMPDALPGSSTSYDRWEAMLTWHKGRCAICRRRERRHIEDHDHYTGRVRGWLCHSCNVLEGVSGHGVLVKYRERHPAAMWNLQFDYLPSWRGSSAISDPEAVNALAHGYLTIDQVKAGVRLTQEQTSTLGREHRTSGRLGL
jgi:hypothetical protein